MNDVSYNQTIYIFTVRKLTMTHQLLNPKSTMGKFPKQNCYQCKQNSQTKNKRAAIIYIKHVRIFLLHTSTYRYKDSCYTV